MKDKVNLQSLIASIWNMYSFCILKNLMDLENISEGKNGQ